MVRPLQALLVLLLPLLAACSAPGHRAFSGNLLDAPGVSQALARGAILWDIRPEAQYKAGHIPGAVNVGHVAQAVLDPKTQLFLPADTIASRLGDAGIDPAQEIVAYGARGSAYAYFAQWTLEYFGARHVHVFHDGVDGWRAAGQTMATVPARRAPVKVVLAPTPGLVITGAEVVARVGRADVQFVDTRRLGEFRGEEVETLRGGHIPGALHVPYNRQFVDPEAPRKLMAKEIADSSGMSLKEARALAGLYAKLDPAKETIVYCHTGIRASMTLAVLARLGFRNVRLYHGSWYEYGNMSEAPITAPPL